MIQKNQKGITLIELMIVTAIIAILFSVALPTYDLCRNRARFSEAILATDFYRDAILVQANSDRFSALADVDAGSNEIPPAQAQSASTHGIDVLNGVITVTWMADGTDLAGITYTLAAQSVTPPIQWVTGGTCEVGGYC
ncbi:MAG: prepilin-type N-terminal cleavage/methylation domain-containing protein [Gammaproteobacteria bacterium]|jgi:type IV pilus assembly protein PilA|nr:prepilin-type N-terminal cleavage/methylation domain-containing protein [Gammaproteobacteria bacterium]MDP6652960.1 prepilin-type N-terminal cleavage/methylation domain-containing protein [Gammaproteobacteria bacterium]|tara:strand:+ start:934 stop:1350 length:417 start_codon:yes stop_codon:yes gene_type:complete